MSDLQQEMIEAVASFTLDPFGYSYFAFPWEEEGELEEFEGPREWQCDILADIRDHLNNPETRFEPLQLAVASGHGIGKSALIGMVTKWALDTCEDCRIVCTANTDGQLRTKTVPEINKWAKLAITSEWFTSTATAIYSNDSDHMRSWRADFVPWSKDNSEAFAGLHNKGKRIVIIFDEASAIDDLIWEVTEGALTDEGTEIIWIAFGNPTRNVGRFRECFRRNKKYWNTRHIDARNVSGTNKKLYTKWADQYGEDSDFMRVRVKGQFPSQSAYQLYSTASIDAANGRHLRQEQYSFAPKVISVDPAWTGDDEFVIGIRQGLYFQILETHPKNDNDVQMANRIARIEDEHQADAVFIDGGYGTGIVSAGQTMGRAWQLVWFNEKSGRPDCVNKRAEMYVEVKDWLKQGGSFAEDQTLYDEMVAVETLPDLEGKYRLPPKEAMKELLGRSPNHMDCLAISFAYPVAPKSSGLVQAHGQQGHFTNHDYNPYD
ncbi:hypothetical protein [Marinobacterium jannaschii]|uniref:hypothetical protein n=1 Tax=Marinobacterium jannaschii TaxID=64970 RepID=UPI000489446C|nr:hypothetical protein [Marinobacterium jannaschii]